MTKIFNYMYLLVETKNLKRKRMKKSRTNEHN
jgi:hypothetical protein